MTDNGGTRKYDQFGPMVRDRRERLELTQDQLAREVGISQRVLSLIERGDQAITSPALAARWAARLGIDPRAAIAAAERDGGARFCQIAAEIEAFVARVDVAARQDDRADRLNRAIDRELALLGNRRLAPKRAAAAPV